jgi:outer membrane protein
MKTLGKLILSAGVVFFASHGPVHAESYDLVTLYKSAIDYDADTAAAKAAYFADQEGEGIALAGLLPNINASAQGGRIDDEVKKGALPSDSYKSSQYGLTLSQPLFSMPEWYALSSAEFNSARAEAAYLSAQQSLILNVAEAYFNVLRAQEDVTASRALETAVKRQYEQAREQFEVGLIAITDVHEAKASFDSSQTTRIRAEGALTIATESLSRITGEYATELDTLSEDYPIKIDPTTNIQSWVNASRESNLDIIIAQFSQKALEADYKGRRAGHYPTLTLTAGYEDSELENYKPGDRETEQTNVFLNFNLPIYSGGGTQASTRQARYRVEQAKHNLTSAQRAAEIATRSEYINIRTNVQTVESLQQNIVSRQSALEATREGYNVGTRNIVEVLDAERNYFTALRDYASARFDFVISTLKIKQAAGLLHERDLTEINEFLVGRMK